MKRIVATLVWEIKSHIQEATRDILDPGTGFWGASMDRDVRAFVAGCPVCVQGKPSHLAPMGLPRPLQAPYCPWSHITLDFIMGLPSLSSLSWTDSPRQHIFSPFQVALGHGDNAVTSPPYGHVARDPHRGGVQLGPPILISMARLLQGHRCKCESLLRLSSTDQ